MLSSSAGWEIDLFMTPHQTKKRTATESVPQNEAFVTLIFCDHSLSTYLSAVKHLRA